LKFFQGEIMNANPLLQIKNLGQSIWLDYIHRTLFSSGEFQQLIDNDGVCGVTSNPAILEKAIAEHDYDAAIEAMQGLQENELYEQLAIEDLQKAADLLYPIYQSTQGRDGLVSFEVSPLLADNSQATIREARRLWAALNRPNSLIKVPATTAGIKAIQQLICDGINVNATLLFSLQRYREVAEAYLSGLEMRVANGEPLTSIASVASFFLSRIDTLVDSKLDVLPSGPSQKKAQALRGQVAIASARLAYQEYKHLFSGERWQRLAAAGARSQRLLWASTSTKDPACSDVKYVEALVGAETINTLPLDTLAAYRDHGQPAACLEHDITAAQAVITELTELGIDLGAVTEQLEKEGVEKFTSAFTALLENLRQRVS
jgi:transaldolase